MIASMPSALAFSRLSSTMSSAPTSPSTVLIFAAIGLALCVLVTVLYGINRGDWLNGLLAGITLAMANLPEEFPVVLTIFLAFGAAFEVPIVVVVLARMGLVSIEKLKSFRSYFIVLAFIIAAILTPPDVVSQLALAIPMFALGNTRSTSSAYCTFMSRWRIRACAQIRAGQYAGSRRGQWRRAIRWRAQTARLRSRR